MRRIAPLTLALGLFACGQDPRPEPRVTAQPGALTAASAPSVSPAPAAQTYAATASLAEGEDCSATRDELDSVRRVLGRVQAEHAQQPSALALQIKFTVQGRPLVLDSQYDLPVGRVRWNSVRYWLSQLRLTRADGTSVDIADSYYLMESRKEQPLHGGTQQPVTLPARQRELISLKDVPPGQYESLSFNVGVDAQHNGDLSLATGELNVLQNMASVQWMWFTSYIFTQLDVLIAGEGEAEQNDAGMPIDLMVLWENGTDQDLRRVELKLPAAAHVGYQLHPHVDLELDVARLFEGLEQQLVAARSTNATSPWSNISATDEPARTRLANNWSTAFRAVSVTHGPQ